MTLSRVIDTAVLPPRERAAVEALLDARGSDRSAVADGFSYEITANGETFTIADESAAPLLEKLLRAG